MPACQLSHINVFPVKSVGGVSLSQAWVEKQGMSFDRRFMVAYPDGGMVTARRHPQMVTVRSALLPHGLIFSAPELSASPLTLRYDELGYDAVTTNVWKDTFTAYSTNDAANQWFSQVVGQPVQLLYTGEQSQRFREKVGHNVSFADGYPLLMISQGSLDELNRRSLETHSMSQFRPNLVVASSTPFIEDSWKRIRIGEVEFLSVKPCERCVMTTVDTTSGQFRDSQEPLKTLLRFRQNQNGGADFGQNLVALNEGMISIEDDIEVLEYHEPVQYHDDRHKMECVAREVIARDFVTFWLRTKSGERIHYRPGQSLPIELHIDGKLVTRHYSLSSSPTRPDSLAISVKRVAGGRVSNWLMEHLQVGDSLVVREPEGRFYLGDEAASSAPLLLLSAGSGITPMLSMLRYLADRHQLNDVVFFHQCRSKADIPCMQELEQLNHQHPGLAVRLCLTQPDGDWHGLKGRLSLSHIKPIDKLEQRQVYVCGPEGFMNKAKQLLTKKGLPESAYHQESFGVVTKVAEPFKALQLTINQQAVSGNNQQTLLDQAEAAGLFLDYSCRAGTCGACRVHIDNGEVEQADAPALSEEERQQGLALACCCVPKTDVTVTGA
ncbi:MOSC N-terminal beta barrel domain-containing protein [Vibrio zhugei]|uniref:MOSC N-terminal beta barrel domain-containing protein n=1 Tax=Vibrio zhugei TaxID=2479546 RepID=A0ABV7C7W2_9VIBR|nr:hybrid-cluster NAD(P)-dependent oxidoreductase [Vibrio zhugei]